MATLLDTDVAIELRDGDPWVLESISHLNPPLLISAVTRVELENGVHRDPTNTLSRQIRLDRLLQSVETLDFGIAEIREYRRIIAGTGFSRRKTADRMTAATARTHNLPLATLNGADFRDVPDLQLIAWTRPNESGRQPSQPPT